MKKAIVILLLAVPLFLAAQPPNKPPFDTKYVYDKPYSFERAKKLEWEWEFEKAVWYYINLVPVDIKQAAARIKNLKNHIGNPAIFINTTFKTFAVYDPEINAMVNDTLVSHKDVFDKKRQWADRLMQAVGP